MIVYKATNKINGKVYVGQTVQTLKDRIGDHKRKAFVYGDKSSFKQALRDFGMDSFEWEILNTCESKEELYEKEKYWISFYDSMNPEHGYNMTTGSQNSYIMSKEARIKIGLAGKGRVISEHQKQIMREKLSGPKNPWYGKHHSEETKKKCGIKNIGRKLTPEHIAKCIHIGESNNKATITCEIARQIKIALASGERNIDIQKRLGVSKSLLQGIKHGKTWRHVHV